MLPQNNQLSVLLAILAFASPVVMAEDHSNGWLPREPALSSAAYDSDLKAVDLQNLPLDAPRLRIALAQLATDQRNTERHDGSVRAELDAAMTDLQRRGDAASPLLLDMMNKNLNTDLEHLLPLLAIRAGTMNMSPFVSYWRNAIQSRGDEINASAAECATQLFIQFGSGADVDLMRRLAMRRPFLDNAVNSTIRACGQPQQTGAPVPGGTVSGTLKAENASVPRPAPLRAMESSMVVPLKEPSKSNTLQACAAAAGLLCLGFWIWKHRKQRG